MNKSDLIQVVSSYPNVSGVKAEAIVNGIIEHIKDGLRKGETLEIRGFGTLKPVVRKERVARDILRQESVVVPEHKSVRFNPSKNFKL